jgi:LAO/AO transport system kinase
MLNSEEKILKGDTRTIGKLIKDIEDEEPSAIEILKKIYPYTGKSHIIGITGSPGAGKSTLVDVIIKSFREEGKQVGVLAVDPTSPFTGGALLGDRIRMQRHALDDGVFIRSLATRGWLGGLSKATNEVIHVMDAMGKDIIIVETVGVGQGEVDIVNSAHTSMVVLVPGMGDDIQMIKAGILEIADIFVINKADRGGTDKLIVELKIMLDMIKYPPGSWKPMIFLTEAINDKGIKDLTEGIEAHREFLLKSGKLDECARARAGRELRETIQATVMEHIFSEIDKTYGIEKVIDGLVEKDTDPHSISVELIKKILKLEA